MRDIESAAGVREGDMLAGKYRVERVLGVGGMGVVVSALHVALDTKVAIKFLLPEMLRTRDSVTRFAREARAAVKITSEHVARVFDVGVLDNGAPYMVMELLDGGDLADWVKKRGPLPVEQAVDFVLQACVAVADAHGLGIVHRDLKPANLFCVRRTDGQLIIKVLDFGISKVTQPGSSGPVSVTQTSALMGSPLYMSPEQMRSTKTVDAQTDIWSLGVILFELLTGKTPFDGDTLSLVAIRVATEHAPLLRSLRPDAPLGLEAVVSRCLEKEAAARYKDIGELAAALQSFGSVRAKASVDRIAGIVQSGRSSPSLELGLPPPIVAPTLLSSQRPPPQSAPSPEPSPQLELVAQTAQTADPVGGTVTRLPVDRTARIVAYVGGVGVALVVVLAVLLRGSTRHEDPRPATATSLPPVAVSAPPTVEAPKDVPSPSPEPPATAPATATTNATAEPVAPAPQPHARPTPAAAAQGPRAPKAKSAPSATPATPQAPPAGRTAPAAGCDPPFYFDPNGTRVFKKECL